MRPAKVHFEKEGVMGISRGGKANDRTCDVLSRTSSSSGH